ncbi:TIGR02677 family protein [Amycolatopsis suaedae]|uniref:TIGR02677 family protein n=1 Tax=Amycolatopsis suaedae TaxID=2510978 RepID=A0A4Q7J8N6_9PSEU|nr:TIGR02677 family protein [Amycolatopsis suaedae]RZQ63348.1 TIGR02677 family protein [Amycolatopsis suaedae]
MKPNRVLSEIFRFVSGDRAELHVSVLRAFSEAGDELTETLSVDGLRTRLRAAGWPGALTEDDLVGALEELRAGNLVDVIQDHVGELGTATEYERRNLRYCLTRRGEAAFAGISRSMEVLASAGALQTAVLDALADRLGDLVHELDAGQDRRVFSTLIEVENHLGALREGARRFNGDLQRLLRADGADLATFHEVKASTVAYLQEFLTNLEHRAHTIATRVREIGERGVDHLHQRALRGAELPRLTPVDPAPEWLARRREHWTALRNWFLPADGATPRAEQLHLVARQAIVTLLQVLDRITESRRQASSAVADFRELARWFTVVPGQDDLHRLWSTMFGLSPARHAHLADPDPELVSPRTSWRDAPPVEVAPRLWPPESAERSARAGRVRDVTAIKAARAERALAERAELEAAWNMIDTGGTVRLSGFTRLDHSVFERLLDLLGRALDAGPDTTGARRSISSDGRIEILLRPPPDGATAVLTTARGEFRGPDYEVELRSAGGAAQRVSEAGAR